MAFTTSVEIDAPPARVWDILVDVGRWPDWTDSMSHIELLDAPELAQGSRARIRQPRLPAAVWTVTEFEAGRRFTWQAPVLAARSSPRMCWNLSQTAVHASSSQWTTVGFSFASSASPSRA